MPILRHYNLKLPDEVAIFSVPREGIRCWDHASLVYDVAIGEGSSFTTGYLRHYSFFDRWYAINVSLDAVGRLLTETNERVGFDFTFNCDIATPMTLENESAVSRVDLELDVLAASDGRTFLVKDEEDFARSVSQGWITSEEAVGAQQGLTDLLTIIQTTGLIPYLESICPFAPLDDLRRLPLQPATTFLSRARVPFFAHR
jgi:hypothetical protein